MRGPDENVVKVVVGEDFGRRSAVWRIWSSGDDVYAGELSTCENHVKSSLHGSGIGRHAYVNKSAAARWLPIGADRAFGRWTRAGEYAPGATMLFRIMIPQAELRQPLLEPTPAEKADGVTLQAPPRVGWVTYLSIVATTPGVELAPFPAFPSALIHRGSLASQTLWVTAHEEPPNVAQADSLRPQARDR